MCECKPSPAVSNDRGMVTHAVCGLTCGAATLSFSDTNALRCYIIPDSNADFFGLGKTTGTTSTSTNTETTENTTTMNRRPFVKHKRSRRHSLHERPRSHTSLDEELLTHWSQTTNSITQRIHHCRHALTPSSPPLTSHGSATQAWAQAFSQWEMGML